MKKKTLALVLALTLVVVGVVSGTLAWLTAKSDTVVNIFTTSDIKVELTETKGTGTGNIREFKMVPGYTIKKDPQAKVLTGSEECFLFVKLTKSGSFDTYLEYIPADGWTQLTKDEDGKDITDLVYYREVLSTDIGTAYSVLKNDQVTVKGSVTKTLMDALNAQGAVKPALTITAYASQLHKNADADFTPAEAWANIQ